MSFFNWKRTQIPDRKVRSHILQRDHEQRVQQWADEKERQVSTFPNYFYPLQIQISEVGWALVKMQLHVIKESRYSYSTKIDKNLNFILLLHIFSTHHFINDGRFSHSLMKPILVSKTRWKKASHHHVSVVDLGYL